MDNHYHCPECGQVLIHVLTRKFRYDTFVLYICPSNVDHIFRQRLEGSWGSGLTKLYTEFTVNDLKEQLRIRVDDDT